VTPLRTIRRRGATPKLAGFRLACCGFPNAWDCRRKRPAVSSRLVASTPALAAWLPTSVSARTSVSDNSRLSRECALATPPRHAATTISACDPSGATRRLKWLDHPMPPGNTILNTRRRIIGRSFACRLMIRRASARRCQTRTGSGAEAGAAIAFRLISFSSFGPMAIRLRASHRRRMAQRNVLNRHPDHCRFASGADGGELRI
jgi:hypothetical protein